MMDFDRAMNVRVNGKEVIRFALNGVTIWEKYSPASILLESDKSYVSEGGTINLTATVNDKFNRPCPNKNVDFYICDQLIQSVEEPYEATRDAKYFLSEGDFTNKSIEFTVDAISGNIDILCEAATIHPFFRMTGLQVGDIVKITDDGTFVKGYVNDTLMYTANHINNPGMIGFSLPNGATLTFSHFTEKGDVLIDSDMTDDTGVATVSYLVQDTQPLNIKAKCGIILSETFNLFIYTFYNTFLENMNGLILSNNNGTATLTDNGLKCLQVSGGNYHTLFKIDVPLDVANHKYYIEYILSDYNTSDNTPLRSSFINSEGNSVGSGAFCNTTVGWQILNSGWVRSNYSLPKGTKIGIHVEDGNYILYKNDVQVARSTQILNQIIYFAVTVWQNQYNTIRNFSIKQL